MEVEATQLAVGLEAADFLKTIALEIQCLELWEQLHAFDPVEAYVVKNKVRKQTTPCKTSVLTLEMKVESLI